MTNMKQYLKESHRREKICARTLKGKALLTIDHLLSTIDIGEDSLLNQIYTIAHSATGVCQNEHKDWVEEISKLYTKLVEAP